VDHPAAQLLHGAGQDVLIHFGPAHGLSVHLLLGHLRFTKTKVHAGSRPSLWAPAEQGRTPGVTSRGPSFILAHGPGRVPCFRERKMKGKGNTQDSGRLLGRNGPGEMFWIVGSGREKVSEKFCRKHFSRVAVGVRTALGQMHGHSVS
jgi:hypothetical protein